MDSLTYPLTSTISARRKVLFSVIAATCQEVGFHSADNYVLDVLMEMFQAFLSELSYTAKCFSEHSGRSEPLAGDVYMALIEMGFNVSSLFQFAQRSNRIMIPNPSQMPKQQPPKILQTGKRRQHPSYIPDYLPPFPDSHSYIGTPAFKQPVSDYETLREKSSMQKRDVERALTRFMARTSTSNSYSLFTDKQSHLFPLIGIKMNNVPYISALLPKDRIWNAQDNQFQSILNANKKSTPVTSSSNAADDAIKLNESIDSNDDDPLNPNNSQNNNNNNSVDVIENPFLLPPKIVNFQ
ncbi:transcription initiation factor TFIID subunit 8-like protein [Euroglyphus maynei]|uniref:Transcription initiation factor TFIID subunit 8 n=1 Tax=Euroglyphus maynei TaxID=6958 RepID=A0A1Y3BPC9_EURMA|nr:transcription initiation factor TFIID subunit 8-like protein [Euroglyphus maynei]